MFSKLMILASILIICAFIHQTSAQYVVAGGAYPTYGGYYGDGVYAATTYGYAYPGYGYYVKRSAGFQQ